MSDPKASPPTDKEVKCSHVFSYLHTNLVGGQTSGSWCIHCKIPMPEETKQKILAERQAPFKKGNLKGIL